MNGADAVLLRDDFVADVPRGKVLGTEGRRGVDRYQSLAVDHEALRIVSLRHPGWGSTALSYGPYSTMNGLAFGALLLNGHNTAQSEPLGETLATRFKRWLRGNEVETWRSHLLAWVRHGRRRWTLDRFHHWIDVDRQTRRGTILRLDENLSVGYLPAASSSNPLEEGNSFVMHATGPSNGELWISDPRSPRRVLASVQNVPLYLLTVVQDGMIIHYGGSVEGVRGLPTLPAVRPLAIVPRFPTEELYASIQQACSGQIGFAADTRVWQTIVGRVENWSSSTAAPLVDDFPGDMEPGGVRRWSFEDGAGLIRVTASAGTEFELRAANGDGVGWTLAFKSRHIEMTRVDETGCALVASSARAPDDQTLEIQISDDGHTIGVHVAANLVFDEWIVDDRDRASDEVCLRLDHGLVHQVQAHRREIVLPEAITPSPIMLPGQGASEILIYDTFDGPGGDLNGRRTSNGVEWARTAGTGQFRLTGASGLRVDASIDVPLAGRTAYTVPVNHERAIELDIDVVPPGSARGEGAAGRAGVMFWQDDDNALIVSTWLDDQYEGASMSSFFRLGGFEDLYDAIWTNVGSRIGWGRPYRLRVAFDGLIYTVMLDDELVLYRSLVDVHPDQPALCINRVGIVANWEWGTDSGSEIRRFTAKAIPADNHRPTEPTSNREKQ